MGPITKSYVGYYDGNGDWVQLKHCFVSCGDKCDCMPPFNEQLRHKARWQALLASFDPEDPQFILEVEDELQTSIW